MKNLILIALICFCLSKKNVKYGNSDHDFLDYVANNKKNYKSVGEYAIRFAAF